MSIFRNASNRTVKDQIEKYLKKSPGRWRILAYKYGEGEGGASNFDGHATAIRCCKSTNKIEFVDNDGSLVNHIKEETENGQINEISWIDFDFGTKDLIYLYTYKHGAIEYKQKE